MYGFYTDDGNLFVGKEISQDLQRPPKEELFRLFRLAGHDPRQRNIRIGNIQIECKNCGGRCCTSTFRRDAWCVTTMTDALRWCMVMYDGEWWCIGCKVVYVVVSSVLYITFDPDAIHSGRCRNTHVLPQQALVQPSAKKRDTSTDDIVASKTPGSEG